MTKTTTAAAAANYDGMHLHICMHRLDGSEWQLHVADEQKQRLLHMSWSPALHCIVKCVGVGGGAVVDDVDVTLLLVVVLNWAVTVTLAASSRIAEESVMV